MKTYMFQLSQERIPEQAYLQSEAIEDWLEGWIIQSKAHLIKGFDFKKQFYKK